MTEKVQISPKSLSRPGPQNLAASYSHGIVWNDLLFIAGQVAYGPDGNVIQGGIEEQTRQTLENLAMVCKEAGTSIKNMLKITVYMTNIADFPRMDKVYKEYFTDGVPPTRATVEVSSLVKTGSHELLVEMEGIAGLPEQSTR